MPFVSPNIYLNHYNVTISNITINRTRSFYSNLGIYVKAYNVELNNITVDNGNWVNFTLPYKKERNNSMIIEEN